MPGSDRPRSRRFAVVGEAQVDVRQLETESACQPEVLDLFRGLELVEPGLVYLPEWRPADGDPGELTIAQRLMVGGIARKP
ncbi:SAM-dependent methyltransferase [Nocardia sp. CWNU-33]|uniref:SAM-dependent methyltransferase n=1 Tax=Nocardia sp. CWNU-33 TaxID=3392117 RepID=UPI00398EAEC3